MHYIKQAYIQEQQTENFDQALKRLSQRIERLNIEISARIELEASYKFYQTRDQILNVARDLSEFVFVSDMD